MAMAKRRFVANAQLSKAVWTIVDQVRTHGTLQEPSKDDLVAAAILEQIAIILRSPHSTTQKWFDFEGVQSSYLQTTDPDVVRQFVSGESAEDAENA